ncbi:MAG: VacJ family lipoprotein [Steroidobacteraceae bacterium]
MSRPQCPPLLLSCLLLAATLLGACTTAPGRTASDDPWQGMNRSIYKFNDAVDRAAIKPVAKGYQKITPGWMRTGISNFFNHLETPWIMVNEVLQGKPQLMAQDVCRFVLNTIVGLGGFIDVAQKLELGAHDEDFGQTLAVWGVPSGPYLMLPFFGPSTVRDGFGRVPDYYARPTRYADIPWETSTAITALEVIQTREQLLSVEDTLNQAYDKYGVMRDAWLQRREYLIYDGNPPESSLEDMDLGDEPAGEQSDAETAPPP